MRSMRGEPVSADVYLRGKASRWAKPIKVARDVAWPATPVPPPTPSAPPRAPSRPTSPPPHDADASVETHVTDVATTTAITPPVTPITAHVEPVVKIESAHTADSPATRGMNGADITHDVATWRGVTIAVVDPVEAIRVALRDHFRELQVDAVVYDNVASLIREPDRRKPIVLVLGPSEAPNDLIERLEPLLSGRTGYGAVMVVYSPTSEIMRAAFRAGVDDVVTATSADAELLGAVTRSVSRMRTPPPAASPSPPPPSQRKVITVFGTKGGTGKSLVAVNVAAALARQTAQPTVLVDANLQFGDAAIMLQLPPAHTIAEAAMAGDRLDGELLDNLLLRHDPSGLLLLAAPPNPEAADQIGRAEVSNVITILRERYAYVVIDTSPRIEEGSLAALDAADDILLLTNLDVMSLKNARLALQTLQALGIQQAKVKLVLNQANTQGGLTRADAERAVRMKVSASLPSDPSVADSVNRGIPMVISAPTSKFALSVEDLARVLSARPAAASK